MSRGILIALRNTQSTETFEGEDMRTSIKKVIGNKQSAMQLQRGKLQQKELPLQDMLRNASDSVLLKVAQNMVNNDIAEENGDRIKLKILWMIHTHSNASEETSEFALNEFNNLLDKRHEDSGRNGRKVGLLNRLGFLRG